MQEHIEGLQDVVYHFRVIATNSSGTATSADQTFTFHPPVCPNQTVRQQTGAAYLPDCRAYELVSPEDAGGTLLFTGGPQSPYASNPPRLAFVGQLAAIPGSGRNPINTAGDLYVATRGAEGWSTATSGPPQKKRAAPAGGRWSAAPGSPTTIQNDVMADPGLNRIIDWNLGNPLSAPGARAALRVRRRQHRGPGIQRALRVERARGLPRALADLCRRTFPAPKRTSPARRTPRSSLPAGRLRRNIPVPYFCSTYVDASKDLNHFVFSTQSGLFGGGDVLSKAPGSAYDNDTANNTLQLISKLPGRRADRPGARSQSRPRRADPVPGGLRRRLPRPDGNGDQTCVQAGGLSRSIGNPASARSSPSRPTSTCGSTTPSPMTSPPATRSNTSARPLTPPRSTSPQRNS